MNPITHSLCKHLTNKHLGAWHASRFGNYNLIILMWNTRKAMHRVLKEKEIFGQFKAPAGENREMVGLIHLNLEDISAATFNHELFHASQYFLKDAGEEPAAIEFEECTRSFWKWYYSTFEENNA